MPGFLKFIYSNVRATPVKPWGSPAATLPRVGSPAIDTARAEVCNAAMKRVTAFAVLLVVLAAPAWADFSDGVAAYNPGDYAIPFREIQPQQPSGLLAPGHQTHDPWTSMRHSPAV